MKLNNIALLVKLIFKLIHKYICRVIVVFVTMVKGENCKGIIVASATANMASMAK